MDRAKLERERDHLEKELGVMVDLTNVSKGKGLLQFLKGNKAKGKMQTKERADEIRLMRARLKEIGQLLADMPDKEERFP